MWELFLHSVEHALLDTLPLLPWLAMIYIVIELLENKTNLAGSNRLGGRLGPVIGSATGLIPQCGFSVMAAKLFEQKYITLGTLIAIFLSTSDEAFIILLSSGDGAAAVLPLIAVKIVVGIAVGYAVDGVMKAIGRGQVRVDGDAISAVTGDRAPKTTHEIFMKRYFEETAVEAGCSCGREHEEGKPFKNFVLYPLLHALKVAGFILLVNFLLTFLIEWVGEEKFASFIGQSVFLQPFLTAALGLIPNCASSVVLATTYLEGGILFGSFAAGLCANAGLGFVVLLKNTRKWKRNLALIVFCYAVAVVVGLIINALPFAL